MNIISKIYLHIHVVGHYTSFHNLVNYISFSIDGQSTKPKSKVVSFSALETTQYRCGQSDSELESLTSVYCL